MDIGMIRGIGTAVVFIAFIGVVLWAYSSKRKSSFDEAANLPFADEDDEQPGHDKPAASQDTAESRQDKGDKNT